MNFAVSPEKKQAYTDAAKVIGISISDICRKALDNAIVLAETLKTSTPSPKPPEAKPPEASQ